MCRSPNLHTHCCLSKSQTTSVILIGFTSPRPGGRRGCFLSPFPSPVCANDTQANVNHGGSSTRESLESQLWILFKKTKSSSHHYHLLRAYHTLNFTFGSDSGRSRQALWLQDHAINTFAVDLGILVMCPYYGQSPCLPQCLLLYFFHKVIKTTCYQSWLSSGNEGLRSINNNSNK